MSATKTTTIEKTGRMSAEERRDEVLDVAIVEFARYGLHGASTERIAVDAGISQPYIFRLFGTKKELFIAATGRVCKRIRATFEEAVASNPHDALFAMGHSYKKLLSQKNELLVLLQAFAASEDHEVQSAVRKSYVELIDFVKQNSGTGDKEVMEFFALGMLLTVGSVLDLMDIMQVMKQHL